MASIFVELDNANRRMDSVKDIGATLSWIGAQSDLDARKVAVYGGSYGGFMSYASMIEYNDRLAAGITVVGISNFLTFLNNTSGYRRDLRRAEYGDDRDGRMREYLQRISPLTNVARIKRPMLIIQGGNDPRVPATEATQMLRAIRGEQGRGLVHARQGRGARLSEEDQSRRAERGDRGVLEAEAAGAAAAVAVVSNSVCPKTDVFFESIAGAADEDAGDDEEDEGYGC